LTWPTISPAAIFNTTSTVGTGSDTLTFGGQDAGGSFVQLDDISLVASTVVAPEPMTLALLGVGLGGLGVVVRRRRR
jgi:hypothetical protein